MKCSKYIEQYNFILKGKEEFPIIKTTNGYFFKKNVYYNVANSVKKKKNWFL